MLRQTGADERLFNGVDPQVHRTDAYGQKSGRRGFASAGQSADEDEYDLLLSLSLSALRDKQFARWWGGIITSPPPLPDDGTCG
ncbi:hypothetical protein ACFFS2_16295 [Streptomyces aurantiacus]|uniref:Uncharacterized protein n=1 Tax=Streptomyces aurantiacus TaxID=47760 RepID=A0A7G1NUI5_9ACTN|nr:hypothetical protein [Streptomyces aurantiacus]BCL26121.1 hypothetical protein GCM10017557_09800 [Streptomyces aurantiacus]